MINSYTANTALLLCTDFDGVWTDNTVYTGCDGSEYVRSSKSDSLALNQFRKALAVKGLPYNITVITNELNQSVRNRCSKLCLEHISCENNKEHVFGGLIKDFSLRYGTRFESVFIGNDFNDLNCIKLADISACPSDAELTVMDNVDLKLNAKGGNGCIREFLNWYSKRASLDIWT
jgi:3-deoxy-D-manno-octulosonate 8-phosphate phosphatase KdsC-like HAD superfamily phosphatase